MNNKKKLTNKADWDKNWEDVDFYVLSKSNPIRYLLEKYIPQGNGEDCLEIGCFPGTILAVFGELGYRLNGLDFADGVDTYMPKWLENNGYETGFFEKKDFFELNYIEKFKIVCSFGFIEHFINWEEVLIRQTLLVKQGGYLIVTAPNFAGFFQGLFFKLMDRGYYEKHYIPSIDPIKWSKILKPDNFEILYCDYFGKFNYWINNKQIKWWQNFLIFFYKYILKQILTIFPVGRQTSLYCGIIAKKK